MKPEQKKLIFEYMEWKMDCEGTAGNEKVCFQDNESTCVRCEFYHPLDGNDMVAAIIKMRVVGDWYNFLDFAFTSMPEDYSIADQVSTIITDRFFDLMGTWLEGREK